MSRKGTSCLLQVTARNEQEKQFINTAMFWSLVEEKPCQIPGIKLTHYLLEFDFVANRKRFVHEFCDGKIYGKNTYAVKFGSWPDVPYGHLIKAFIPDDLGMVKCPSISCLELRYPEIYYELVTLYEQLGVSSKGGYIRLKGANKKYEHGFKESSRNAAGN